jgi:hypothetical protein
VLAGSSSRPGPCPGMRTRAGVLETHGCQAHDRLALLDVQRTPEAYARDYTTDRRGQPVPMVPSA